MNRWRSEEGSTLVEFALSSSLLFLCLFGIFAFCSALYAYNFVGDAAREASRYAMVRGTSCVGFTDCKIKSSDVKTYVQNLNYPGINTSNLDATRTFSGAGDPGDTVSVTVTYSYGLNIPFWPKTGRILNLSSTSQMVVVQ